MADFAWEPLLREWASDILTSNKYRDQEGQLKQPTFDLIASSWLGHSGATEAELIQTETRLGITLPLSYRTFLAATNGWGQTTVFIYKLLSSKEIDWLTHLSPEWVVKDENYPLGLIVGEEGGEDYEYDSENQPLQQDYLETALLISAVGDAIYLLNPKTIDINGEWEAWWLTTWNMEPARFPSFWDMMQEEHKNFLLSVDW